MLKFHHRQKRSASLQSRMISFMLPMVIFALLTSGLFSYAQTQKVLRQQKLDMIDNFNDKVETSVTSIVSRAVKVTEVVLYFSPIYNAIFSNKSLLPSEQVSTYKSSVQYFKVLENQFEFKKIRVFMKNDAIMYQNEGTHFFSYDSLKSEIPVDITLNDRTDQIKLVDTYENISRSQPKSSNWQLSVVRFLVDGSDMFVRAAVCVDINAQELLSGWNLNIIDPYELLLINEEGHVLSSSYEENIGTSLSPQMTKSLTDQVAYTTDDTYYAVRKLEDYGWYLCARVPLSYLYEDTESILFMTGLIIALACVVSTMFIILLSKALTERLRAFSLTLQRGINQKTMPETLSLYMTERKDDYEEIRVLLDSYNRLISHIGELNQQNTRMISRESRYRMEALRLQINAHFLYNTLASIKGYIELNDAKTASKLIMKLASFFNLALDRGGLCIELREEIQIIQIYLEITQMVYTDDLTFDLDLSEDILDTRVPRFILQPIIENAIVHGVAQSDLPGRLTVRGRRCGDVVAICIDDSGPGFSPEILGESSNAREGIGLRNVRKRLALYFTDGATMRTENNPQGGGRVTIHLPIGGMTNEEATVYDKDVNR